MSKCVTGLFTAAVETWCMTGGRSDAASQCWPEVDGCSEAVLEVGSGGRESGAKSKRVWRGLLSAGSELLSSKNPLRVRERDREGRMEKWRGREEERDGERERGEREERERVSAMCVSV